MVLERWRSFLGHGVWPSLELKLMARTSDSFWSDEVSGATTSGVMDFGAEDHCIAPGRRSTSKLQSRVTPQRCEAEAVQLRSGPVQPGSSLAWKRSSLGTFLPAKLGEHVKGSLGIS